MSSKIGPVRAVLVDIDDWLTSTIGAMAEVEYQRLQVAPAEAVRCACPAVTGTSCRLSGAPPTG